MPLLAHAKKIQVLAVGERSKPGDALGEHLADNLGRYELDVEFSRRDGDDTARVILREAQTWSASMLVMGAYGHSRLRQFVFGGVTNFMMASATLPVLMMH
jgi:nucleotide-binding universal stress UspA family protein